VRVAPNVPGLIRPIRQSQKKVEKALLTVNTMETRWNMGIKKSRTECVNELSPSALCSLPEMSF
jgi:hypothetical protein